MKCAPVLLVLCFFFGSSFQCREMVSVEGYSLIGHAVTSLQVPSLQECMWECSGMEWCKSLTYNYANGSCDLNNVTKELHPGDYVAKEGFVYWGGFNMPSSCAEIKETSPEFTSGHYLLFLRGRYMKVYCDMENYGGGWTLVVKISKDDRLHLIRGERCKEPFFCVPFVNKSDEQEAQKLDDEDIGLLAGKEGVFRLEAYSSGIYTAFYKVIKGPTYYASDCKDNCPRIIISYEHPYKWESNCNGTEVGYVIHPNGRVFDGISDRECGSNWYASQASPSTGPMRLLYAHKASSVKGLFRARSGAMYVR